MCQLCQADDCSYKDLNISEVSFGVSDSIPGNTSTTETISVGQSVMGNISPIGDTDWFEIQLVAGETYEFSLVGTNNGNGALFDPLVRLMNASGTQVAFDDDGGSGLDSLLNYTATVTGTYYVVADVAQNSLDSGYTLSVSSAEPVPPTASIDWGTQLTPKSGTTEVRVYFAANGETFDGETSAGWSATEIQQVMAAFATYENYINLTFVQVGSSAAADFQLVQNSTVGGLGYFNPPGTFNAGVGAFNNTGDGWNANGLEQGGYGFVTLIHEFGHALGLAHPHDGGGSSPVMQGVVSDFGSYGSFSLNQGVYTTMSYNDGWELAPHGVPSVNAGYGWQGTIMALDIAVLQDKYGANTTTGSGNDTYTLPTTNAAGTFYSAIWDTGGTDEIVHNGSASATINLNAATLDYADGGGGFISYVMGVHGGFTIAAGVVIENASGGTGSDTLIGNSANNILEGNTGADSLDGGDGTDTASYQSSGSGLTVSLGNPASNTGDAAGDSYTSIENLLGSNFADTLSGDSQNNEINGGGGLDTLSFAAEASGVTVRLDLGTATGASIGSDTLVSIENVIGSNSRDIIFGDNSVNVINAMGGDDDVFALGDNDIVNGGDGNDTLNGNASDDTLNGDAGNDTLFGADGADTLNGGDDDDVVSGGAGNDILSGNDGADTVLGGGDDDQLFGNNGNDTLSGGGGNDTLSGGADDDLVLGAAGNDTVMGGDGVDVVSGGEGVDSVSGGAGNDEVYGAGGDDTLVSGGAGNDTVSGGSGNDNIMGDADDDNLIGSTGNDRLDGGTGADILTGGADADVLVFAVGYENDRVHGFEDDVDTLEFDDALWFGTHGTLTEAQVVATFATQVSPGIIDFDFGNGDTLRVVQGAGISTADLVDDILIV